MKVNALLRTAATALLLSACALLHAGEGKLLAMQPLTVREVHRLLRKAGRQDAVPEGRVVTQGLAAMTGFALGLTKALGGVLLYDIITANVTADMLNEDSAGSTTVSTQEICFSSRNARSLEEAHAIAEFYNAADREIGEAAVRKSGTKRRYNRRRRKKHGHGSGKQKVVKRIKNTAGTADAAATGADAGSKLGGVIATATLTSTPTAGGTQTTNPAATTANTATAGGTSVNAGTGTATSSTSTTMTSPESAINCVVIEKGR